jgi:hypothetical protein
LAFRADKLTRKFKLRSERSGLGVVGIVKDRYSKRWGMHEYKDIFLRELRVRVRKREKGRISRPIFMRITRGEA